MRQGSILDECFQIPRVHATEKQLSYDEVIGTLFEESQRRNIYQVMIGDDDEDGYVTEVKSEGSSRYGAAGGDMTTVSSQMIDLTYSCTRDNW